MRKTQKATFAKPSSLPTKLAIALSSVMAAQAFAADYPNHHFGVGIRTDLKFNNSDVKPNKNKENKSNEFGIEYLRLNFAGDLTPQTSYRVRFHLNRDTNPRPNSYAVTWKGAGPDGLTGTAATNADDVYEVNASGATNKEGVSSAVDYAYLTHNLNDNFAVRAGKFFWNGVCGREGDYNGEDVYFYSDACNQTAFYKTGIGFMPMFSGQTLVLAITNGDTSQSNHRNFGYGVTWYGDIADGMIQPIVAYAVDPSTEQKDNVSGTKTKEAANKTYLTVGTRINFGDHFFEVDYVDTKSEDDTVNSSMDEQWKSWVFAARARLMGGSFQPYLKYVMDEYDDDDSNKASTSSYDRTGWGIALEYYPEMLKGKGTDWRVHAAYDERKTKFDMTGAKDVKDSVFRLGFSWVFTNAGTK